MLSALELAGFKSFAERTRFEFPDGITVIVGPNGSGKSNVVDAIKWVLGAQSAKALRGKDMSDVIFKGSTSAGRKPANSAEATLVFDNTGKQLAIDADEVNVTRRVYRSGDSEYLINGQSCRLKDIKDLFRGTGVGADAYSLIEQGKVERMLQASPKDRRMIFEEAAGISRFNAKKLEANRRLARVEQNLVRLKDIVDEVHARLTALQRQAEKANNYRQMTLRLRELRLRLGWTEYSQSTMKLAAVQAKLESIQAQQASQQDELNVAQEDAQQAELQLHRVARECQLVEADLQEAQQRIAVNQSQQASLQSRAEENRQEQQRQAQRLAVLRHRAVSSQTEVDALAQQVARLQTQFDAARRQAEVATSHLSAARGELAEQSQRRDTLRRRHLDILREVSEKSGELTRRENLLSELGQSITLAEQELAKQEQAAKAARKTAEQAAVRLKQIHAESSEASTALARAKTELDTNRQMLSNMQEEAAVLKGSLGGTTARLNLLEQLEQHLEGVDAGARHLIALAKTSDEPAFLTVRGLVAEQIDVDVDIAALVDVALGPAANAIILENGLLIQRVRQGQLEIPGRLSLLRLDRLPSRRFGEKVQLEGVRGVLGRADRLVRCETEFQPLVRCLLGTTWLVESLDIALELSHFRGAGLRFVTAACQLIDSDGLITIGALQSSSGLVSRRSEIHSAREEIDDLKLRYQKSQGEIERISGRLENLLPTVGQLETTSAQLNQEFARQQASAQNAVGRLDEIEAAIESARQALATLQLKQSELGPSMSDMRQEVEGLAGQTGRIEGELAVAEELIRQHTGDMAESVEQETAAKIELARIEQRLESATISLQQSSRSQEDRLVTVKEAEQELLRLRANQNARELEVLDLTSLLAEDFLQCEAKEAELDELAAQATELRSRYSASSKQLESLKRKTDKLIQQRETSEVEHERYLESRTAMLKRFQEDYEITVEQLQQAELIETESELTALDQEASKIRQDISTVGEINMTALAELDDLQNRYDALHSQYEDLRAAKESLQRIIQKINQDSRRMFLETLEIIRQNFQKLYRKSFGGGNADIVLEEGEDVLECGIDIIATPPGKTALSNSLLSGGEKALTAVALLLAIFQYRPSPFCVLDEVDAPFDEANIGRFVSVLTEFLDWTKFIIVTHSKKTMTASTTLYGVTMQESGVSKQVAVRFEDVNDKGEILSHKKAA